MNEMTAEDARNLISMLVSQVLVSTKDMTTERLEAYAWQFLKGEEVNTACSEGCCGVESIEGSPGFVLTMESGKRFHITAREMSDSD